MPSSPDPSNLRAMRRGPSAVEVNKALVLQYFEMWNTGQGAVADELLASTYVEHAHPDFVGPAASRALVPRIRAMYPGLVVSAEIVSADADYVAARTSLAPGNADGHPDGPRRGMVLFRIAEGRLAEQWSWYELPRARPVFTEPRA